MTVRPDPAAFIAEQLRLAPVAAVPEISLYSAHPGSGLWRLGGPDDEPPYWAYPWGGGQALARHILDNRGIVAGRRVLDLGCGGGLVAIAAALAGAAEVLAADIESLAMTALRLNAEANGVNIRGLCADLLAGEAPAVDLILVGDLFYDPVLASRVGRFLDAAGIPALIGDPGRATLPRHRLKALARHAVSDFGSGAQMGTVFAWEPLPFPSRASGS